MITGVNATPEAIPTPIREAAKVLERIATQDLRTEVRRTYAGDLAAIKDSINTMVGDLRTAMQGIGQTHRRDVRVRLTNRDPGACSGSERPDCHS